jgi:ABC-type ATPase involved in cell division
MATHDVTLMNQLDVRRLVLAEGRLYDDRDVQPLRRHGLC